jgi:hypothetical protein
MSKYLSPESPFYNEFKNRSYSVVTEKEFGKDHTVYDGAPCEWSAALGASHTLYCGDLPGQGTRPAKLLKTVMYVADPERGNNENIVWNKWDLIPYKTLRC